MLFVGYKLIISFFESGYLFMDFHLARKNMLASQVRTNRVNDPLVIDAMYKVPREVFLPPAKHSFAYLDKDLQFSSGRFLMQPLVAARLLQMAEIQRTDHVLVLPCGCGYLAALLSHMAGSVVAVEEKGEKYSDSSKLLIDSGVDTVAVIEGIVQEGCVAQAPFDAIIFDGGVTDIPEVILGQLAEGGRLVGVIGDPPIGRGTLIRRNGTSFGKREEFDVSIPILPEFKTKASFIL